MSSKNTCPCESGLGYKHCCGPYHKGEKKPQTPLLLMRSRYSAFVLCRVDYIEKTMRDWAFVDFNAQKTRDFCSKARWHGLKIVTNKYKEGSDEGEVEFKARYQDGDGFSIKEIHERSLFKLMDGNWYYVSSIHDCA